MDILRNFFENEKNKQSLLIIFLAGIVIALINSFSGEGEVIKNTKPLLLEESIEYSDYTKFIENKLEEILSKVDGAGDVSVMITLDDEGEKVLSYDYNYSSKETEEADNIGGLRTIKELSESTNTLFSNNNPVILKENTPKVKGVVIIANGGDNPVIVESFTRVSTSLLDVPAHKVQVLKKK